MKLLTYLLLSAHGREKVALGGRGAVSSNPRAASRGRRCISGVGP